MAFEFKLPDIGEGVTEGEVVKWLVKQGDQVKEDQPIVEIMTDKATVEIASPKSGTIESLLVKDGDVVQVGKGLVSIQEAGEAASAEAPKEKSEQPKQNASAPAQKQGETAETKKEQPATQAKQTQDSGKTGEADAQTTQAAQKAGTAAPAAEQNAQQSDGSEKKQPPASSTTKTQSPSQPQQQTAQQPAEPTQTVLASPATRKMAREHGVSLSSLAGTGDLGRVTKDDVQKAMGSPQGSATMESATSAGAPSAALSQPLNIPRASVSNAKNEERIPVRGIRKKIVEHMRHSIDHAAHFTHMDEFDATNLVDLRNNLKENAAKYGVKLNYLPFIVKATCLALRNFPRLNGSFDEEKNEIVIKHYINMGVAVATKENDLIVPVIQNADQKSILEIAAEIKSIADKAQTSKLAPADLQGGTFTITSLGPVAGTYATPIINWPELGILGFFAIKEKPVVFEGEITIRHMANLALSLDHRIVDGYLGAQFCKKLIEYLENPASMLLYSA